MSIRSTSRLNGTVPCRPVDRDGKIRIAYRPLDLPREPGLVRLASEQTEPREEHDDQQTERGAEPAKYSYRSASSEGLTEADIDLDRGVGAALVQRGRQVEPQRPETPCNSAHPRRRRRAGVRPSCGTGLS